MDDTFHLQESNLQRPSGFLARLRIIDSILPFMRRSVKWLAGLIKFTKEEKEDAGVYLGHLGNE